MSLPQNTEERWQFLFETFDVDAFAELAEKATSNHPDDLNAEIQFAEALGLTGQLDAKLERLRALVERKPQSAEARVALGLELLRLGRYREGWPFFEARAKMKNVRVPDAGLPPERRWGFQPVAGQQLLLVKEQGLGDTLQFIRYVDMLRNTGAKVYSNVQPALRPLLQGSPATGTILNENEPVQLAYWFHLMDLVPYFHPTLEDVQSPGAYIAAPPSTSPFVIPKGAGGPLRVGVAWAGSENFAANALRSIPLPALAPLRDVPRCSFYSLMPADRCADIADADADAWLTDLSELTTPFSNLARAVSAMDVVVSVCTSIAHLAAAMGTPTLVLLSGSADWRWGRERNDTPWYPSATLLRQHRLGDWSHPVEEACARLNGL